MAQTKIVYDAIEASGTEQTLLSDFLDSTIPFYETEADAEPTTDYPKKMKITITVEDIT